MTASLLRRPSRDMVSAELLRNSVSMVELRCIPLRWSECAILATAISP